MLQSNDSVVGESDSIVKTPKKTSKTSSPFEPIDKNSSDNQSDRLCNGDDQFRYGNFRLHGN